MEKRTSRVNSSFFPSFFSLNFLKSFYFKIHSLGNFQTQYLLLFFFQYTLGTYLSLKLTTKNLMPLTVLCKYKYFLGNRLRSFLCLSKKLLATIISPTITNLRVDVGVQSLKNASRFQHPYFGIVYEAGMKSHSTWAILVINQSQKSEQSLQRRKTYKY